MPKTTTKKNGSTTKVRGPLSEAVMIYFTPAQKKKVVDRATKQGQSMSSFIRSTALAAAEA